MIQHANIPKRVVAFVFFIYLSAVTALFIGIIGSESILIAQNQVSLIGAIPIALLAFVIGCIVVSGCTGIAASERLVVFVLLLSLEFILSVFTALFFHLDDEQWLHQWAVEMVQDGIQRWDYSALLAGFYSVFGANLMLGKVINALVTALLPFLVFGIARSLFSDGWAARGSFYWCCCNVALLMYGAFSLKESLTAFLLTAACWGVAFSKEETLVGWFVALGATLALALRPIFAGILILAILVYCFSPGNIPRYAGTRWLILGSILLISIFLADFIGPAVYTRVFQDYLEKLQEQRTFAGQIFTSTNALAPSNLLIAALGGVYAPPPVRLLMGVGNFMETITMVTWYVVLPFSVLGCLRSSQIALRNALAVTVIVGSLVTSASLLFAGVPDRHRMPLFPLLCVMAGNGRPTRGQVRWFYGWWLSIIAFNILYWRLRVRLQ
jgi:hypothetical protein